MATQQTFTFEDSTTHATVFNLQLGKVAVCLCTNIVSGKGRGKGGGGGIMKMNSVVHI